MDLGTLPSLGDFKCHLWHSRDNKDCKALTARGKQIADLLSVTNLGIVNEDITIDTLNLLPALNWRVTTYQF